MKSLGVRCECCYNHAHKVISTKDYLKLSALPEHQEYNVFIRHHNCPRNMENRIEILAESGKLVLVRQFDEGD